MPGELTAGEWNIRCTEERYSGQPQGQWEFWLDRASVPALTLRSRRTGDRLKLPDRPAKTVKKWCIYLKIPAHLRDSLPVLALDSRVAAVAGLGPDAAFLPGCGSLSWHIRIVPAGNDCCD